MLVFIAKRSLSLSHEVPEMLIQITTEAVGRYRPVEQIQVVKEVKPRAASVSIAELLADNDIDSAMAFYQWCESEAQQYSTYCIAQKICNG